MKGSNKGEELGQEGVLGVHDLQEEQEGVGQAADGSLQGRVPAGVSSLDQCES